MAIDRLKLPEGGVTVRIFTRNTGGVPYTVTVKDERGRVYYYRDIIDNLVIFGLPYHPPTVIVETSAGTITSILVGELKPPKLPYIDEPETARPYTVDQIKFVKNYNIDSPARMFTNKPVVEYNPNKFEAYWIPVREFILWHEIGHVWFSDEVKADRWATITFLNKGWNLSTALYALTRVLGVSEENAKRRILQDNLLQQLSKRYYG